MKMSYTILACFLEHVSRKSEAAFKLRSSHARAVDTCYLEIAVKVSHIETVTTIYCMNIVITLQIPNLPWLLHSFKYNVKRTCQQIPEALPGHAVVTVPVIQSYWVIMMGIHLPYGNGNQLNLK